MRHIGLIHVMKLKVISVSLFLKVRVRSRVKKIIIWPQSQVNLVYTWVDWPSVIADIFIALFICPCQRIWRFPKLLQIIWIKMYGTIFKILTFDSNIIFVTQIMPQWINNVLETSWFKFLDFQNILLNLYGFINQTDYCISSSNVVVCIIQNLKGFCRKLNCF